MSVNGFRGASEKARRLRGEIPQTTIVIPGNYDTIMLSGESLVAIANHVSTRLKRKLTPSEVEKLYTYISSLSGAPFYKLPLGEAQKKIAAQYYSNTFLARRSEEVTSRIAGAEDIEEIEQEIPEMEELNTLTLHEYQRAEIDQLTTDENQFKFTAHHDRRGNAVIDRERVNGERSTPNGVKKISRDDMYVEMYKGMKMLRSFLAPESIDEMFSRSRTLHTTYFHIALPHQILPLDSRNRSLAYTVPNEYMWLIHSAGTAGQLGNMRIKDTLQQVISVQVSPMWLPISSELNLYYGKVRMLIKEFTSQSAEVTEFLDPDRTDPTTENYHFEFEIKDNTANRMYIVPSSDTFHFRKPFARVETITVLFRTPFEVLNLQADSGTFTTTNALLTLFSGSAPHNLSTGDLVYVYNFNSGNLTVDSTVNQKNGWIITKISATDFTIPFDTLTPLGAGGQTGILVYFAAKRINFQLHFVSLEQ